MIHSPASATTPKPAQRGASTVAAGVVARGALALALSFRCLHDARRDGFDGSWIGNSMAAPSAFGSESKNGIAAQYQ